jgi:predicted metalloprotease with PDZ domain
LAALAFTLDLTAAAKHLVKVELSIGGEALPAGPVELFMPVWTPGSYLVRELARNMEGFAARASASGKPLPWRKTAKNRFRVERRGQEGFLVAYAVYGHEPTVRAADFTAEHAFWNAASIVLWPVGREELAATFELLLPEGWTAATALRRRPGPGTRFAASSLHEAIDAPVLAGCLDRVDFQALGASHSFVVQGLAGAQVPPSLAADTAAVIGEAAGVFGGQLPYDSYLFLAQLTDKGRGGLEHSACCALLASRATFSSPRAYQDFQGLVAHEHFHAWNGKRMRPRSLWQCDYERENHTELLWFVEGATAYYDDLLCLRAGVIDTPRYLEILGNHVTAMHATPGRLLHPLAAASFDAWIKAYRPDENSRNSTQSYYTNGALAMLCLDLRIRAATNGARSLDDAIADLYQQTFLQGRGYDFADVVEALSRAAGRDLGDAMRELVEAPFDPDFDEPLAAVGLSLMPAPARGPYFGLRFGGRGLTVSSVLRDSPAMHAGLSPGDELIAVDGLRVRRGTWADVVGSRWCEGRTLDVLLARRGRMVQCQVKPAARGPGEWKLRADASASADQRRLRQQWFAPRGRAAHAGGADSCDPSQ